MPHLRDAAAILLLRNSAAGGPYEVYLARRNPQLAFLGGFHAFPGGATESVDEVIEVTDEPVPSRFCSAVIRETFEELGVLLAPGAAAMPTTKRNSERQRLLDDADTWPAILNNHDLHLDAGIFTPMGIWVTPPYSPIRFAAHYLAAWLPEGQEPEIWPGELTEGLWATAADAIAMHHAGDLFITYPVLKTLEVMAHYGNDLAKAAKIMCRRGDETYPHAGGEMIPGVHILPVRTATLPPATHTNSYVLGGLDLVVVDPATADEEEQERLLHYLAYLESKGGAVTEIWLTHQHPDHVGAVQRVREVYRVPVAAHRLTAEALEGTIGIDRIIDDDEVMTLDTGAGWRAKWQALHTPGHAAGHLCFYEQTRGTLISGDNVLGAGTVMIQPPEGNMQQYMNSLRRLRALEIGFLFPAHGPPVAAAREKIQEYIDHRTAREEAILAACTPAHTAAEIVPLVYTDVPPAVHPLAEVNVNAHLEKLVAEGRVESLDDGRFAQTVS